jgi:hypothetical protein
MELLNIEAHNNEFWNGSRREKDRKGGEDVWSERCE